MTPLRLAEIRTVPWQDFAKNRATAACRVHCLICGYPADDDSDDTARWYVHQIAGGYLAHVLATVRDEDDLGWSPIHDEACVELVPSGYRSHVVLEENPDDEDDDDR